MSVGDPRTPEMLSYYSVLQIHVNRFNSIHNVLIGLGKPALIFLSVESVYVGVRMDSDFGTLLGSHGFVEVIVLFVLLKELAGIGQDSTHILEAIKKNNRRRTRGSWRNNKYNYLWLQKTVKSLRPIQYRLLNFYPIHPNSPLFTVKIISEGIVTLLVTA